MLCLKNNPFEITHWLRALATFAEDPYLILSYHISALHSLLASVDTMHTCDAHKYCRKSTHT